MVSIGGFCVAGFVPPGDPADAGRLTFVSGLASSSGTPG
jgi:hypothetical protein